MGIENKLKLVDENETKSEETDTKDEIQEIMNEIENLKQSMTELPSPKSTEKTSEMSELLDETLDTPEVIDRIEETDMAIQTQKNSAEEGCLTMTLSGSMTLRLQYEYADQAITIGFVDQMLRVELSDGTEFKIPVHQSTHSRKAA
jgi:hypothetical protein